MTTMREYFGTECAYCAHYVLHDNWPAAGDLDREATIKEIEAEHAADCQWVILERDSVYP